jgi:hypothetical protein
MFEAGLGCCCGAPRGALAGRLALWLREYSGFASVRCSVGCSARANTSGYFESKLTRSCTACRSAVTRFAYRRGDARTNQQKFYAQDNGGAIMELQIDDL